MKINVKKVKKNLIKAYATVAVAANTIALNATAFAAEGSGGSVFLDSRRWLKVRLMRISVDLTQVLLP